MSGTSLCQRGVRRQGVFMIVCTEPRMEVLLVDDNAGDVRLTREAFREGGRLTVVEDGVQASDYLWRRGEFADAPRPDLILLDLNLPRKKGRELLRELKSDPDLRRIPVMVMTT